MKRTSVEEIGPLKDKESFTGWCISLANKGWLNGWPIPLLLMDEMDHPASPHSMFSTEDDFSKQMPLSAKRFGIGSYKEYREFLRRMAWEVQTASPEAWRYVGWPGYIRRIIRKLRGNSRRSRFSA